ncbi:hypothetical protein MMC31_003715 [Peltigera leucophlebia]|nr:hypothetical protein [Peltigera leucophlebia]
MPEVQQIIMPKTSENVSGSMPNPVAKPQLIHSIARESFSASNNKAVVVGLYGVPGSGKTFLLGQLKGKLGEECFAFYEGSQMIASFMDGGLDEFKKLEEREKMHWRRLAIDTIGKKCAETGKVGIVGGHFMFWSEEEVTGCPVYTKNDLKIFTHILYLDVPADVVAQRRLDDAERNRPSTSITHLRKWQQAEKTELRKLCRDHGVLFSLVSPHSTMLDKTLTLLGDFRHHTEEYNLCEVERRLDETLVAGKGQQETILVMDADKTLAAEDTGALFWERVPRSRRPKDEDYPLKTLFQSPLGYSYTAFRQATLLYEETADDQEFDALCQDVASAVTMRSEFVELLQLVAKQAHVGAVVVTCGLRRVWEKVLEREGLSQTVKVIGGGRISDGFVVTGAVKAALVARLQNVHQMYVWAFGDSPLDLGMLSKADQAIVVVGENSRSTTMDDALTKAIVYDGLRAHQALLPRRARPRLDTTKLPVFHLTDPISLESIVCRRTRDGGLQVLHATDRNAAKLLMTPMRDANLAGPVLREAHRRVGWYLATEFLADLIGIEEFSIAHVQGHDTSGYRLFREQKISIVALMRGGEPMALGVNDAIPLAMFVHASRPEDLMLHHLHEQLALVLVDSVINSGKTVVQFVQHVRNIHATIRIVVIAGVVQAQSVSGPLAQELANYGNVSVIALRLSANKFIGRRTTDTGNRLFNTTHLP